MQSIKCAVMTEQFLTLLKETLEIEGREISRDDVFRDYKEWDSLSQLSLIAMLDDAYGVEIEMVDFNRLITVGDLMDEVMKRKNR